MGYESVNTARGALSALGIVVEGCRAGNHPLVNRFMRGIFNLRPSQPRYVATWDVKPVLLKLRDMDPLHSLSLKEISLKLVMLMALTQAARLQTLHLLLLKDIKFSDASATVLLGGNIKQCRPKFNIRIVEFKAFDCDPRLCVFRTLKEYVKRTETIRQDLGNENAKLLVSYVKPHRGVSKDTIARWIRMFLEKCGVDTKKFTAGSVRHAATSVAKAARVPITTIMAKAGWTQEATFAKFYDRSVIEETDEFQEAVLGSV